MRFGEPLPTLFLGYSGGGGGYSGGGGGYSSMLLHKLLHDRYSPTLTGGGGYSGGGQGGYGGGGYGGGQGGGQGWFLCSPS